MNKLQKQVIESCIDTRDVFDSKKLSTKSYSEDMEKRRQEEQLIMEARVRNIKKNYQQKYESLHQTYLYQCEQLKQQLSSEIKKEMYNFEKKMEIYLKQISDNDRRLNRSGLSLGMSNNNSLSQQLNNISQTLCTEQTLNQSSVNDLFNFVESHDNSIYKKNPQYQQSIQHQSSIATFTNQPQSFRALGTTTANNNTMLGTRALLTEEEYNNRYPKVQQNNEMWNKENNFDQNGSFLSKNQKSKSILKNNSQIGESFYKNNENTQNSIRQKQERNDLKNILQVNQNRENTQQTLKSKNWETIKQIRQQIREQPQSPRSPFIGNNRTEKCLSMNAKRNTSYNTNEKDKKKLQDKNRKMNNSFQIPKQENQNNINPYHNLSFTNLNQFENGSNFHRYNSTSSSDSETDRHLDTDRLKRFKIDNINLIKGVKSNQIKVQQNQYYYK